MMQIRLFIQACFVVGLLANIRGDIAIHDADYSYKNSKKDQILLGGLDQYQQRILDSLQIKEKDLIDPICKKTKQANGKILQTDYLTSFEYDRKVFPLNNDESAAVTSKIENGENKDDFIETAHKEKKVHKDSNFTGTRRQHTRRNNKSNSESNTAQNEGLLLPFPQTPTTSDKFPVQNFKPNFGFQPKQMSNAKINQTVSNVSRLGKSQEKQLHHRGIRAATAQKGKLWDYGVVPYEIDGNFNREQIILFKKAMMYWENFTCLKFVERDPMEHPNYLIFTVESCGCCSSIGKEGEGAQTISIGKSCGKFGTVVHELGHTLGFDHEHSRPDRDSHVIILENNIKDGKKQNFEKLTDKDINSLGMPYDYDSIMHYSQNTFGKEHRDTILPIDVPGQKRPKIGQRVRLSEGDIAQTNLLYKCPKCGKTFQANSATFSSPSYLGRNNSHEGEKCEWRITATHGERIILDITELDIPKSPDCRTDYIEIRDGYWHKSDLLGKFCGTEKIYESIVSTGSRMLVTYVNKNSTGHRGFTANYHTVCGGELSTATGGHLESPNFPENYQPNKKCIWKITVPDHYQLELKFQSFEVETVFTSCDNDYVEVRDGLTVDSLLIGVYCGYKIPPNLRSSSNYLLIKFVSDGSVQKAGFSATFVVKEFDESNKIDYGSVENPLK